MPKPQKIKNYSRKGNIFTGKSRKSPWKILLSIVGVLALAFIGWSVYGPVYEFFTGATKPNPLPEPPPAETSMIAEEPTKPDPIAETAPPTPAKVAGIELPYNTAIDPALLTAFLDQIPEGVNTVVVNVKNSAGEVLYNTSVAEATAWEAVVANPMDLLAVAKQVKDSGYSLAVRISVFSDPVAARGDLDNNAIMHTSGVIWIDNTLASGGKPWTTPYSPQVRRYNQQLVKECADAGASFIILDYMRFPGDPTNSANVKNSGGETRPQILDLFYKETKELVGDTPLAVSVGRWILEQGEGSNNNVLYGGNPTDLQVDIWAVEMGDTIGLGASDADFVTIQGKRVLMLLDLPASADRSIFDNEEYVTQPF